MRVEVKYHGAFVGAVRLHDDGEDDSALKRDSVTVRRVFGVVGRDLQGNEYWAMTPGEASALKAEIDTALLALALEIRS